MHHIAPFNVQCYAVVMLIIIYHCSLGAEIGPKRAKYLIPFLRTGRSPIGESNNNKLLENIISPVSYEKAASFDPVGPQFLTFSQWFNNRFRSFHKNLQPPYLPLFLYQIKGNAYYTKREDYTPRLGRNAKGI